MEYVANGQNEDHGVSFSVEKVWQSYSKNDQLSSCSCDDNAKWKEGVQKYYTGTRKATWKFRGPSYDLADNVMWTVENVFTKFIYFANSNTTVLTPSSTAILETLAKCKKLGKSSLVIISEWDKVLSTVVREVKGVVSKFSKHIGTLASAFNDALACVYCAFSNFMRRFLRCETIECKQEVNYIPLVKKYQILMNTVALIAETIVNNKCNTASPEAYEAETILILIFQYFSLTVQGINSCVQDILFRENGVIAENICALSESMNYVLLQITPAVAKVVYPFDESIQELLTTLINVTIAFNTSVKRTSVGVFKGVKITVGEIAENLFKDACEKLRKDRRKILKGCKCN
ncbi:hypothetical protein Bhyg_00732 [Pseudolycoriella hygida]|uniref:Uncharacterized protein n=1 Tax=Pseudolycoriella hygida TaxID=35572 RepID=A0A9Q0N9Q7_9DIPT|nr:hypothetical protein Bhyg_00732 [Pseudolycoriella hygida]